MRTMYIPGVEASIPIGKVVQAVKVAIANPNQIFKQGITCWWPCTGREIRQQFLEGIQDRINQAIPYIERGMK